MGIWIIWFSGVVVCQRGFALNCWMPGGNPSRCISQAYICDGQNDCFNGFSISDEFGCSKWSFAFLILDFEYNLYFYVYINILFWVKRSRIGVFFSCNARFLIRKFVLFVWHFIKRSFFFFDFSIVIKNAKKIYLI